MDKFSDYLHVKNCFCLPRLFMIRELTILDGESLWPVELETTLDSKLPKKYLKT